MAYIILCVRFTCFVHLLKRKKTRMDKVRKSQIPPQAQHSIRVVG